MAPSLPSMRPRVVVGDCSLLLHPQAIACIIMVHVTMASSDGKGSPLLLPRFGLAAATCNYPGTPFVDIGESRPCEVGVSRPSTSPVGDRGKGI